MLIGDTWHWERIKEIEDYPDFKYQARCSCEWESFWTRNQRNTARSDWEDHVVEQHKANRRDGSS